MEAENKINLKKLSVIVPILRDYLFPVQEFETAKSQCNKLKDQYVEKTLVKRSGLLKKLISKKLSKLDDNGDHIAFLRV